MAPRRGGSRINLSGAAWWRENTWQMCLILKIFEVNDKRPTFAEAAHQRSTPTGPAAITALFFRD